MTTILNYYGGTEKWIIDTSIELSKRYPDLDISILTRDNNFTERLNKFLSFLGRYNYNKNILYKISDVQIREKLGNIKYKKIKSFKILKQEFKKYDIIYSKNEILEAFIFKFIIGYQNIPKLIFGCHTALYYPQGNKIHNFIYTGFIYTFLTSGVYKFHVLNNSDENILLKNNRKVIKIFNPVNKNEFDKNLAKKTGKWKINKNKFNLVWIGRLTKQKGVDFLIEIADFIYKNKIKNIILNIAGDGELKNEIINLTKKYDFIRYYGHIENEYIPNFLSNMNLYIHTSLWESFGLTIIEANLANLPVLAFNIPGPADIIENGKNGFLVQSKKIYLEQLLNIVNGKYKLKESRKTILELLNDEIIYFKLYNLLTNEK